MTWSAGQQKLLLSLITQRNEQHRISRLLQITREDLKAKEVEQTQLASQLASEQADVERLNKLSWSNLYHSFLNRKREQLSREEAEVAQIELAYVNSADEVSRAKEEVAKLQQQLDALSDVEPQYEAMLAEKRAQINPRWDEAGREYNRLLNEVEQVDRQLVEVTEAFEAGKVAQNELHELINLLHDARNTGLMDMFNVPFASFAKLQKLDTIRTYMSKVNHALRQFKLEYADLGQSIQENISLDGWDWAGSLFFDNIFSDMATQSRIDRALETAHIVRENIVNAMHKLARQVGPLKQDLAMKSDALEAFLVQA